MRSRKTVIQPPRYTRASSLAKPALAGALILSTLSLAPKEAHAARPVAMPAMDASVRQAVVDRLTEAIGSIYVLGEPAKRIVAGLRQNLAKGDYDKITDPSEFARRLEQDAQAIHRDGHFSIRALPPLSADLVAAEQKEDPADVERRQRQDRARNYGFVRAEIMPGGVGYLRFDRFSGNQESFEAASAGMNFIANSNAVILDLRHNTGGSAAMIRFLAGYFFEEDTHLINWDIRAEGKTVQSYSADYVPGKKMLEQPVYILTSRMTYSAAEEFSFDLRNLERATLVGETTGGGGHTVVPKIFDFEGFRMIIRLPFGRAYNPETNEGWDGVGVVPHIAVAADQALDVAYVDALKKLIESEEDEQLRRSLQWPLTDIECRANPPALSQADLQAFVGSYGPLRIYWENGSLFYQREGRPAVTLEPMAEDLFRVPELDFIRVGFERDDKGEVVRLVAQYDDGTEDSYGRE